MRAALPLLMLLLAARAGAQATVSMGRLFTTPSERAQLDAQRNLEPQSAPAAPAAPGNGAQPVAGGAPGMDAAPAMPAAGATPAAAAQEAGPPADAGLRLDGIIRRSNGRAMVIVNGEVQPAPAGGIMRGTVTLQADGRSVVLKPGQRYDPATGEVHEATQ